MARWVAGLDGCRGAWAGVLIDLDDPARWRCARFARIADLLDGPEAPVIAGIDVPIGLPDRVTGGGRSADRAARAFLGAGRASVFPVPPRAAVHAGSYEEAKALSRAGSEPPFAPSIQLWNILRYVREADGLLRARPDLRERLHEVHPEVAFFRLNGDRRLAAGKKGPARAAGLAERRALLIAAGLPQALVASKPPPKVAAEGRRGRPSRRHGRPRRRPRHRRGPRRAASRPNRARQLWPARRDLGARPDSPALAMRMTP
ncbi:MAG: DUF429 domain-containing protein [Methylorubrum populi]